MSITNALVVGSRSPLNCSAPEKLDGDDFRHAWGDKMHRYRNACHMALLAAAAATLLTGTARASCDRTCSTIQTIVNARSSRFAQYKTDMYVQDYAWHSSLNLPGMICSVTDTNDNPNRPTAYSDFDCAIPSIPTKKVALATFRKLRDAIQEAEPSLVWFRVTGAGSVKLSNGKTFSSIYMPEGLELYAGPSKDDFYIHLVYSNIAGIYGAELHIESDAYGTFEPTVPYTFKAAIRSGTTAQGGETSKALPPQSVASADCADMTRIAQMGPTNYSSLAVGPESDLGYKASSVSLGNAHCEIGEDDRKFWCKWSNGAKDYYGLANRAKQCLGAGDATTGPDATEFEYGSGTLIKIWTQGSDLLMKFVGFPS